MASTYCLPMRIKTKSNYLTKEFKFHYPSVDARRFLASFPSKNGPAGSKPMIALTLPPTVFLPANPATCAPKLCPAMAMLLKVEALLETKKLIRFATTTDTGSIRETTTSTCTSFEPSPQSTTIFLLFSCWFSD